MTSRRSACWSSLVFAVAAVAQIVVGHLLDRVGARPHATDGRAVAGDLPVRGGRAVGLGHAGDRRADDAAGVRRDPDRLLAGRALRRGALAVARVRPAIRAVARRQRCGGAADLRARTSAPAASRRCSSPWRRRPASSVSQLSPCRGPGRRSSRARLQRHHEVGKEFGATGRGSGPAAPAPRGRRPTGAPGSGRDDRGSARSTCRCCAGRRT